MSASRFIGQCATCANEWVTGAYSWVDTLHSHVYEVFDMGTGLACTMVVQSPGAHSLQQVYRVNFKRSLSSTGMCKVINKAGKEIRITAFLHVVPKTETVKTEV